MGLCKVTQTTNYVISSRHYLMFGYTAVYRDNLLPVPKIKYLIDLWVIFFVSYLNSKQSDQLPLYSH